MTGDTGPTGPQGETGATGPTGPSGDSAGTELVETNYIGDIDTLISYNQGSGNNQALGALVFNPCTEKVVVNMAAYIMQTGTGTGAFQMAILEPDSSSSAVVVGVTEVAHTISAGLLVLPLTESVSFAANAIYYLAVYNQVEGSQIGGSSEGTPSAVDAPPINFRVQNLNGFTVGQQVSTSDVSLTLSPWLVAYS